MSNLFRRYTHPHVQNRVKDESVGTEAVTVELPQHRPLMAVFARKGSSKVGWYNGDEFLETFGSETVDPKGPYFRNEQVFLQNAIFPNQGCFVTRLIPKDAKTSTSVLECIVRPEDIQQYQRDAVGAFVLDSSGKKIPLLDGGNNPVKLPGFTLQYRLRPLAEDEVAGRIQPKEVEEAGVTTYVYPIFDYVSASAGKYGDNTGFRFFYNPASQDEDVHLNNQSLIYGFAPMHIPTGQSTPVAISSIYENRQIYFTPRPEQFDDDLQAYISFNDVVAANYTKQISVGGYTSILPYNVNIYPDSFEAIGEKIAEVETFSTFSSPWMVNIVSLVDLNEHAYRCAVLHADSIGLSDIQTHYLSGGNDGTMTNETYEELFRELLSMSLIPELQDPGQYPINTIYDTGYSIETKFAMISCAAKHEYLNPIYSCQDASEDLYTLEQSVSVGDAILTRIRMTPESEVHNTPACRGTIMGQAGYLDSRTIKSIIPLTYWIAKKRSIFQGLKVTGEPAGENNNEVDDIININWFPYSEDTRELLTEKCINYAQIKKMTVPFFPFVQSAYSKPSSVLYSTFFVDVVCAHKYFSLEAWQAHVGRDVPVATLFKWLKEYVEQKSFKVYSGKYPVTATAYQTAQDIQQGGTVRIMTEITGNDKMRIAINDIVVKRDNLN